MKDLRVVVCLFGVKFLSVFLLLYLLMRGLVYSLKTFVCKGLCYFEYF